MKARMHFDTLTYANKLKAAGMEPHLAEVQALALVEAFDEGLATKGDVTQTRTELKTEISQVRTELKTEISQLRTELKSEISEVKAELKAEISEVRAELKAEISEVRAELKAEISQLRTELKAEISEVKANLIQWMVGLFITNITLVGGFIAFAQFLNRTH